MEDAGRKHGIRPALLHAVREVVEVAHAPRGDHRHAHRVGHRARECQIEAGLGAIAVHAGQQNLARAASRHLARPLHGVEAGVLATAVAVHVPTRAARDQVVALALLGVDGDDDALRAVAVAGGVDHIGVRQCGRIEAGLVRTRVEQAAHVFDGAHATTHGERNEDLAGHRFDDGQDQIAAIAGRGDVQKREFVRALRVVARGDFHRITGVAQFHKIHAFDDAATGDIQTGNDAFCKHGESPNQKILRGQTGRWAQPSVSIQFSSARLRSWSCCQPIQRSPGCSVTAESTQAASTHSIWR